MAASFVGVELLDEYGQSEVWLARHRLDAFVFSYGPNVGVVVLVIVALEELRRVVAFQHGVGDAVHIGDAARPGVRPNDPSA
jgi:hypothetical protein